MGNVVWDMLAGMWIHISLGSWGGVRLSPFDTSATIWPIVPAPESRAISGMRIGKRNRSTRRNPAPVPLVHHISHMIWPGLELGPPRWEASD
jgi:hypothetical protein